MQMRCWEMGTPSADRLRRGPRQRNAEAYIPPTQAPMVQQQGHGTHDRMWWRRASSSLSLSQNIKQITGKFSRQESKEKSNSLFFQISTTMKGTRFGKGEQLMQMKEREKCLEQTILYSRDGGLVNEGEVVGMGRGGRWCRWPENGRI